MEDNAILLLLCSRIFKTYTGSWLTEKPARLLPHDLPIKGPMLSHYSCARLFLFVEGGRNDSDPHSCYSLKKILTKSFLFKII